MSLRSLPEPLGATPVDGGCNVAVQSAHADAVEVCVFDADDRETRVRLDRRTGDVHHGFVAGLGPGGRYGLRAHGPWAPAEGHRFNPAKLLVDPFAMRLDRPFALHPALFDARAAGAPHDDTDSAPHVPKAVVEAIEATELPLRPPVDWSRLVVYELHVRGFTKLMPELPPEIRGTYAGLGHPAAIDRLVRLGITAVEIMPSAAWLDERHLPPLGLSNYWGYNPVALMAPDPRLAPGGWAEVRAATRALQDAGIAVLLDVVLNHTAESDRHGPTVCYRGLDNATWYRLDPSDRSRYVDDAGCGNILALDRPPVLRLALDALRTWAVRGGFDGFRYDLAVTLARRPAGFDREAPFLAAVGQDPILRDLVHVAEPWDIGPGGHHLGGFPAPWGEWNDRYRDTVRRFWRGDGNRVGDLATAFAGSADVFAPRRRPLSRSVNFVTAHDGFTLADLVAHATKHNEANGEQNRDGTGDNLSWNNGVEGPADDPRVRAARAADARALLATLLLSRGTPMLSMGDECGRSQGGNNNAYAQDNETSWLDWGAADADLAGFTARLVRLRLDHPALHDDRPLTGAAVDGTGIPDVQWRRADGGTFEAGDWHDPEGRLLVAALYAAADGPRGADRALVALNAGRDDREVRLPDPRDGFAWRLAVDSAEPAREPAPDEDAGERVLVRARSAVAAVERPLSPGARRRTGVETAVLDRLATAAGLALDWWDIGGRNHRVPDDTKKALLAALRLPATTTGEARESLERLVADTDLRALPHATVVRAGEPVALRLGPDAVEGRAVALAVELEDGGLVETVIRPGAAEALALSARDGRHVAGWRVTLPDLPLGRHRVRLADRPEIQGHLAVVPPRCHVPEDLARGERRFGLAAHLYSLRHDGDQGIGDFTTLRRFAEAAGRAGAVTVGLNPLHALFVRERDRASPYNPSDRRFLDPVYIDVTDLPPALRTQDVRVAVSADSRVFAAAAQRPEVDYEAVWRAKLRVLRAAFQAFESLPSSVAIAVEFRRFVEAGGDDLLRFALYETMVGITGTSDWRGWPAHLRKPDAPEVVETAADHAESFRFALFQQFLADRQLAAAAGAARDAGLGLGFYRDLAVGCAPDGAEAWSTQETLMGGVSIGAPPDPFSAAGQIWSLPAPDPFALARDGYAGFGRLVAANMAHAGALRIDHVLGLRRLYLVPEGATGAEGAYLAQPIDDLLGHVALESRRHGTLVVGEDLGTVPEGFRDRLEAAGLQSYRVLWFERDGAGFVPPARYPARAAACVSTHDLPTLAGWWIGADIDENLALGRLAPEAEAEARAARERDKEALVAALTAEGLLPERHGAGPSMDPDLAAAVHAFVAATPSVLALVQADDLAGETRAVNLPGTDRERPNWRRRLAVPADRIDRTDLADAILAAMRLRARPGSPAAGETR